MSEASEPVPALSVGGIRRGIYLLILATLQSGVVGTWVAKKTGFSTKLVSIDDLQAVFLLLSALYSAFIAAYVGFKNILTRIHVGQDPKNPAPPVKAPDIVTSVVARFSR